MKAERILRPLLSANILAVIFGLVLTLGAHTSYAQLSYFALTPCRAVDTRNPAGVNGGPALTTTTRNFQIRGNCGVPTTAKAISMNVTITGATTTTSSWLTIWPSGGTEPVVSTINFTSADSAVANGAIVGLSTNTQDLSVQNATGSVHVILDVTGYFQ